MIQRNKSLGEEKCVASVNVIKEHAKETNIAEDTAHTFRWVTGVVALGVEKSESIFSLY